MSTATYRVEVAPSARAVCRDTQCKKQAVKIAKGELRHGTLVTIMENQTWHWKHWGCVTAKVLNNWKEQIDGDWDLVDGLEELPEAQQQKVKKAINQGHIDLEDETERPDGTKSGVSDPDHAPKRGGGKKRAKDHEEDKAEEPAPKKARGKKAAMTDEEAKTEEPAPKKARARKTKKVAEEEEEAKEEAPAKKSRAKKDKPEPEEEAPGAKPKKASKSKKASKIESSEAEEAAEEPVVKEKPKAGRKKKTAPAEEPAEVEMKDAPKAKGRGRPKKTAADGVAPPKKSKRGTKA